MSDTYCIKNDGNSSVYPKGKRKNSKFRNRKNVKIALFLDLHIFVGVFSSDRDRMYIWPMF
jgi:hypothetical protein